MMLHLLGNVSAFLQGRISSSGLVSHLSRARKEALEFTFHEGVHRRPSACTVSFQSAVTFIHHRNDSLLYAATFLEIVGYGTMLKREALRSWIMCSCSSFAARLIVSWGSFVRSKSWRGTSTPVPYTIILYV